MWWSTEGEAMTSFPSYRGFVSCHVAPVTCADWEVSGKEAGCICQTLTTQEKCYTQTHTQAHTLKFSENEFFLSLFADREILLPESRILGNRTLNGNRIRLSGFCIISRNSESIKFLIPFWWFFPSLCVGIVGWVASCLKFVEKKKTLSVFVQGRLNWPAVGLPLVSIPDLQAPPLGDTLFCIFFSPLQCFSPPHPSVFSV